MSVIGFLSKANKWMSLLNALCENTVELKRNKKNIKVFQSGCLF